MATKVRKPDVPPVVFVDCAVCGWRHYLRPAPLPPDAPPLAAAWELPAACERCAAGLAVRERSQAAG